MAHAGDIFSGALFLCGGALAGALAGKAVKGRLDSLTVLVRGVERRLEAEERRTAAALSAVERRVEEQESRLAELPGVRDLMEVMDELLDSRMRAIDGRLQSQMQSIEIVRSAVGETDRLIARVLEALNSLEAMSVEPEPVTP
jgi:hypothetical protein